ncbi:decarboxylating 6-phosphogluconate dehydrogenase [Rhodococcus ruber]|uniref:6-phosphogluconate dehydrogenase-like protein n=1 Tax=Rhodococcus ruber TaxID=1830 RepID=A0A098BN65_9NOCA|nr:MULTISPECIES: decarboxylating 6-phosphogluconate dehydrogenase [Rhodococcus]AUM19319.1 6-phosphogluconate dehydrogenase (decarboxylating) [Rhodococcus ruber]AXY49794.1 6-phosphogluconate dehydrogenase,decarboxylating [Rhodococcus ruber]MBD8054849.1 decarboxylating 6-phosphogluconate dehydrogenase [Rhodococcus ruber]MBP2214313.1 6-phosphogluconate dehydrogenase [Rhodococcus ruber]MCD2129808.1 decarboxylating 6-phosphogluconate dehydrogenase [Rhodococcus ruber]
MQIGMVGVGRMGGDMVRRLLRAGHHCVVYDREPTATVALEREGAVAATSPADLIARLEPPRTVWVMVPAAVTGDVVEQLAASMDFDDTLVDGGNSHHRDDAARASRLAERGIHYLDVGTSGGVHGLDRGYCLMIGGDTFAVERLEPVFQALAPGVDTAPRTAGRNGTASPAEQGYLHCGSAGAGHFVKMVHNGIEYGQMAALAEGLSILHHAAVGARLRDGDAGTAPLADSAGYRYEFDIAEITEVWRRGSVLTSWLLDLLAGVLHADPTLSDYTGKVGDSGEGRWVVQTAVDEGVPASVITVALYERFSSQRGDHYSHRALSALRRAFGGHGEK